MTVAEVSNSSLISNVKDFIQDKVVDKSSSDFAEILKNNFSAIDTNRDNILSAGEINKSLSHLNLDNVSELITKLDLNNDGAIAFSELESGNKLSSAISSTVSDILSGESSSNILSKAVNKIGKAYHLNDSTQKILSSVIGKIV